MKRLITAAICGALVATTAAGIVTSAQAATTTPTITGPASVAYYSTVRLAGTTPTPNQHVIVYLKGPGFPHYTPRRDLHSDGSGHFAVSYSATGTYSYYAMSRGVTSPAHTTRLVSASCTVSGPVFTKFPFPTKTAPSPATSTDRFVAFTATRDGVWAGYAYESADRMAAISWHSGQRTPTVLMRVHYNRARQAAYADSDGSIDIAGITPSGAVVAAVERLQTGKTDVADYSGLSWYRGHTYRLSRAASWTSVHPIGVTDRGEIVGWARAGSYRHGRWYVVTWASSGAHYRVLFDFGQWNPELAVDGRGDVSYVRRDGSAGVRLANGQIRTLTSPEGSNLWATVASGTRLYAQTEGGTGMWDLAHAPPTGLIAPTAILTGPGRGGLLATEAGPRGDVITQDAAGTYLRTARGALIRVPKEAFYLGPVGHAVNTSGSVAFTSAKDGLPRFLRCH